MKPLNLISFQNGCYAIANSGLDFKKYVRIREYEVQNIRSFCDLMLSIGSTIEHFDGFFVSYTIPQIGKEFDLLRFGTNYLLNIEIKSELKKSCREQKILKQMQKNYYYLKFLGLQIKMFTYVVNDGFYQYDELNDNLLKQPPEVLFEIMKNQIVNYHFDPNKAFIPSNYLISPFNSTSQFLRGEYFLTSAQECIKNEILNELKNCTFKFFCISANAGTGKTLLVYDIAREQILIGKKVKIIHCGMLNSGHVNLNNCDGWEVIPIRQISPNKENVLIDDCDCVIIDEAQRIHESQLRAIIEKSIEKRIPIIFSFDVKQYLKRGENLDISDYLASYYPSIETSTKTLTNKIRTNKAIASFITNLLNPGKSKDNLDYSCVTIEYMENIEELKMYISFLKTVGWTPITFTNSSRYPDPYDTIAAISEINAHLVIGQEFSKVVFVMDENFKYSEDGKLTARSSYYSASGMLYQIVTRVVDELKIIVTNNPELYAQLLSIKSMGE